ncbi:MAG: DDE-type integrase/transposase/recombinase [Proteobacteria bacterium]|nr:DDE-type integrase/transposase/recombinase [Pseudomonadota bacterium]
MSKRSSLYKRHRFPPEIIQHVVWLYHRFNLSSRDIEDLMAERGIEISYESIRLWCIKFGPKYANRLRRRHQGYGDTFFVDEVFVKIQGKQHYLWRAVDQDGDDVEGSRYTDPYGEGWTIRIRLADEREVHELMDPVTYRKFLET